MISRLHIAIKREGWVGFHKLALLRVKKSLLRRINQFIAFPFAMAFAAISPWMPVRFIMLYSDRVGHYPFNTELFLSALDVSSDEIKRRKTLFYTIPGIPICNEQIHKMWKRVITILPFPAIVAEIDNFLTHWNIRNYSEDSLKKHFAPSGDNNDRWDLFEKKKKIYLSFTTSELSKGIKLMEKLGVPEGAKFICLLARDSKYLQMHRPNVDWSYHDFRDVSITNYSDAALKLAEKNYYVIRMGKHVKEPFNINHPKIIDYANSELRSDFLDIYMSAHCYFFISSSTGVDSIAKIYKKPLLVTNLPLCDINTGLHRRTLFIPKKVINKKSSRLLSYKEIFDIFANKGREVTKIAAENELHFIENTPQEIIDVVDELEAKLNMQWTESATDEMLQQRFWGIIKPNFPEDIPKLDIPAFEGKGIKMRIGSAFLRNNRELLN